MLNYLKFLVIQLFRNIKKMRLPFFLKKAFYRLKEDFDSTGDHRRDFIITGGVSKNAFYNLKLVIYISLEGFRCPSRGVITPLDGFIYLSWGFIIPLEGFSYPSKGNIIPLEGVRYPSWGFIIPMQGFSYPS